MRARFGHAFGAQHCDVVKLVSQHRYDVVLSADNARRNILGHRRLKCIKLPESVVKSKAESAFHTNESHDKTQYNDPYFEHEPQTLAASLMNTSITERFSTLR